MQSTLSTTQNYVCDGRHQQQSGIWPTHQLPVHEEHSSTMHTHTRAHTHTHTLIQLQASMCTCMCTHMPRWWLAKKDVPIWTVHLMTNDPKGWGDNIANPPVMLHSYKSGMPQCIACLIVGCLMSQQHASVSQGQICSDNCTCCHTEREAADQTFHLTQSQYTYTGLTSPSTDPIIPGTWQGSHWSANVSVTGMTWPRKNPVANGIWTRDLPLSRRTL